MARSTVERQLGRDFADDGGELETMARKGATQNEVRVLGVAIDHEILVGT
jgi:hypothetical protein